MGKRELKKQSTIFGEDFIDILSKLDPSGTNKYLNFMLKMANQKAKKYVYDDERFGFSVNNWYENILVDICLDALGGPRNLELITEFNEHLKNKRIEKTDINQYESWDDLLQQKSVADLKLMDKEVSKQIDRVYEDSEWLVIKPLSFKASLAYGSSTKWCTASKYDPDYFYRYSKNGILLYVLNKNNGKKYGFYKNEEEFSIWNQIDYRIDSMETEIPYELLLTIKDKCDTTKHPNNMFYFSEEEKLEYLKRFGSLSKSTEAIDEPMVQEEERYDLEPIPYYDEPVTYEEAETHIRRYADGGEVQQG